MLPKLVLEQLSGPVHHFILRDHGISAEDRLIAIIYLVQLPLTWRRKQKPNFSNYPLLEPELLSCCLRSSWETVGLKFAAYQGEASTKVHHKLLLPNAHIAPCLSGQRGLDVGVT